MSAPTPFSVDDPCIVCGAGMTHQPDHEPWCASQTAFNRSLGRQGSKPWPAWYLAKLEALRPGSSTPLGTRADRRRRGV